jgi:DNA-directed RNA polymerase specialized sigma24 family protein
LAVTLGNRDLATEAVDEAMARAYARWSTVSRLDNPGGWVYRVALNWSRSVLHRRLRPVRAPGGAHPGAPADPEPAVTTALADLPVDQRSVLVCRYLMGWSEAQTAAALKIRPGTVKSRAHRGLQSLQIALPHLRPDTPGRRAGSPEK